MKFLIHLTPEIMFYANLNNIQHTTTTTTTANSLHSNKYFRIKLKMPMFIININIILYAVISNFLKT